MPPDPIGSHRILRQARRRREWQRVLFAQLPAVWGGGHGGGSRLRGERWRLALGGNGSEASLPFPLTAGA